MFHFCPFDQTKYTDSGRKGQGIQSGIDHIFRKIDAMNTGTLRARARNEIKWISNARICDNGT